MKNNTAKKFVDPKILIKVLESELNSTFLEIKQKINNTEVKVNEQQIKKFLQQKFEEQEPEVANRLKNYKSTGATNLITISDDDIEKSPQHFVDELFAYKYCFEPYTLNYYKTYISILKDKLNKVINLIEKISTKYSNCIAEIMSDLDISINNKGEILYSDIVRLTQPVIFNYNSLLNKSGEANDLESYLKFKISKESLSRDGISENEIYPSSKLQHKDIIYYNLKGDIPLSQKQEQELDLEMRDRADFVAKLVLQ